MLLVDFCLEKNNENEEWQTSAGGVGSPRCLLLGSRDTSTGGRSMSRDF
jgi:hypothetical protein